MRLVAIVERQPGRSEDAPDRREEETSRSAGSGWAPVFPSAVNPMTFGTGNASIDAYAVSKPKGGAWTAVSKISTRSSDPAASATNALGQQFWGDYNALVSTNSTAWFISACTHAPVFSFNGVPVGFTLMKES